MKNDVQCPVDFVPVNEYKVRLIAGFVFAAAITFLVTDYWYILPVLAGDFLLRTINLGRFSPLGTLAGVIITLGKIGNKPVDRAPKRFAAGTGLLFTLLIIAAAGSGWHTVTLALSSLLILFASLESIAGFCAGCYVYRLCQKFLR